MIEELKMILDAAGNATDIAVSIFIAFGIYKTVIYLSSVGAIVLLVKLAITKLHDWATSEKSALRTTKIGVERFCISSDATARNLADQIKRIRGKDTGIASEYIHECSVEWLEKAIDAQIERDKETS